MAQIRSQVNWLGSLFIQGATAFPWDVCLEWLSIISHFHSLDLGCKPRVPLDNCPATSVFFDVCFTQLQSIRGIYERFSWKTCAFVQS